MNAGGYVTGSQLKNWENTMQEPFMTNMETILTYYSDLHTKESR